MVIKLRVDEDYTEMGVKYILDYCPKIKTLKMNGQNILDVFY